MTVGRFLHVKTPPERGDGTSPGAVVREAREKLPLSREKLASQVGVSTSTIARLENRDRLPNVAALVRIAATVGVSVAELLPAPEQAA